jgi:hypothetical protein
MRAGGSRGRLPGFGDLRMSETTNETRAFENRCAGKARRGSRSRGWGPPLVDTLRVSKKTPDLPDRRASSSLSAALNPRAMPSVSRNFTVNASYCRGVTCTSSGASEASAPRLACFGEAPNTSRKSLCCNPLASDARRFADLPAEGGDGLGVITECEGVCGEARGARQNHVTEKKQARTRDPNPTAALSCTLCVLCS